jgi:hypothetical protein
MRRPPITLTPLERTPFTPEDMRKRQRSLTPRSMAKNSAGTRAQEQAMGYLQGRTTIDRSFATRVHSISSRRRQQRYVETVAPRSLIRRCARNRDASVLPLPVDGLLLAGRAPGHCVAPATLASQRPRGPCHRILRDTARAPRRLGRRDWSKATMAAPRTFLGSRHGKTFFWHFLPFPTKVRSPRATVKLLERNLAKNI